MRDRVALGVAAASLSTAGLLVAAFVANSDRMTALAALAITCTWAGIFADLVWDVKSRLLPPLGAGFTLGLALPGVLSYGLALVPAIGVWTTGFFFPPRETGGANGQAALCALLSASAGLCLVLAVVAFVPR